jgi:hypothetical protein
MKRTLETLPNQKERAITTLNDRWEAGGKRCGHKEKRLTTTRRVKMVSLFLITFLSFEGEKLPLTAVITPPKANTQTLLEKRGARNKTKTKTITSPNVGSTITVPVEKKEKGSKGKNKAEFTRNRTESISNQTTITKVDTLS